MCHAVPLAVELRRARHTVTRASVEATAQPASSEHGSTAMSACLPTGERLNAGRCDSERQSIPDRPSVYVYTLPSNLSGTWLYQNLTGNDHDFHFAGEYVFWQRLLHNYPQASPDVSAPVAMKPRHTTL